MGFTPYSDYDYIQADYQVNIPKYWKCLKLKFLASINDESLSETTSPEYKIRYIDIGSVDKNAGITNIEEYSFNNAPSRARRIVKEGDVIISTVRTYLRAIAAINEPRDNLIVSTGFAVIRPKGIFDSDFAAYALRAPYFVDQVVANSTGVSYPAINASSLGNFRVILPPLPEQRAIADFLDHNTAKIDALIEKQERLIALLEEKRSALIAHAVTKGLDLDVPMKDSGVEWLGVIPAHWELRKGKYLYRKMNRPIYDDDEVVTAFRDGEVTLRSNRRTDGFTFSIKEIGYQGVRKGDLVIHQMDGFAGAIGVSDSDGKCSPVYSVCQANIDLNNDLYAIMLQHMAHSGFITSLAKGIRQRSTDFRFDTFGQELFPLYPIEEQNLIYDAIDRRTKEIDKLVRRIKLSISLLQEYRSVIISSAVTGKINVRHWREGQVISREA